MQAQVAYVQHMFATSVRLAAEEAEADEQAEEPAAQDEPAAAKEHHGLPHAPAQATYVPHGPRNVCFHMPAQAAHVQHIFATSVRLAAEEAEPDEQAEEPAAKEDALADALATCVPHMFAPHACAPCSRPLPHMRHI